MVIFHSYVSVPEGIIHHRQYSSLERFEQNHLIAPEMLKCIFYINIYCVCVCIAGQPLGSVFIFLNMHTCDPQPNIKSACPNPFKRRTLQIEKACRFGTVLDQ